MTRASSRSSRSSALAGAELVALAVAVAAASVLYLRFAENTYSLGFPLDDSWIHQSFARTLAQDGEWALRSGLGGSGSTAPLWSALLSIGYPLALAPYAWTYLLGALALFGLAAIVEWGVRHRFPSYRPRLPWAGLFIIFEWHLTWAALSGMETVLHALLLTAIVALIMAESRHYVLMGLLTGMSVWLRPDGVTVAAPVLLTVALSHAGGSGRLRSVFAYCIPLGLLLAGYVEFNMTTGGTPMPSTFYAKQAEYAVWQAMPLPARFWQMLVQLLAGPGIVVLPGFAVAVYQAARAKHWPTICAAVWTLGYFAMYLLRLPVYQHGRYLMPAIPSFYLLGLVGMIAIVSGARTRRLRLAGMAWAASMMMLWAMFIGLGAHSYADDVALIESEMVRTAVWASVELPADALIAAHDIGALGYFDHHALIDLAGLVSPQVIPVLRDEKRLESYLDEQGADYLIAFPGFYPGLTAARDVVFSSGGRFARQAGYENMTIYRWGPSK